jgi:hypothetical protein
MEEEQEGSISDQYVPLKARAYHINQTAIDICNEREQAPAETIIELDSLRQVYLTAIGERDKQIADLKNIVPTDGRPVYTLEEFGEMTRKVCQIEGVMLHERQKGFFREIFASLTQCISDKGLMRK